jgi:hypothetical protein
MLAFIYVDGCDDSTSLRLMNKSPVFKNGFKDVNRQYKHYFEFKKTTFVKWNAFKLPNMQYGGLGSVSVYFYKARVLSSHIGISERTMKFGNNQKLPNVRFYKDIGIMTNYSSGVAFEQPKHLRKTIKPLTKFGDHPVAVLHLHYRPYEWFIEKNICCDLSSNKKGKMAAIGRGVDSSNKKRKITIKKEIDSSNKKVKEEIDEKVKVEIKKEIDSSTEKGRNEIKKEVDSNIKKERKEIKKEINDDSVVVKNGKKIKCDYDSVMIKKKRKGKVTIKNDDLVMVKDERKGRTEIKNDDDSVTVKEERKGKAAVKNDDSISSRIKKEKMTIKNDDDSPISSRIRKKNMTIKNDGDSTISSRIRKEKMTNKNEDISSRIKKGIKNDGDSSRIKKEKTTINNDDSIIIVKEVNVKMKVENNESLRVVKQEKEFQSQNSVLFGKRKSKYREIIEIIDSDDECPEIIYLD